MYIGVSSRRQWSQQAIREAPVTSNFQIERIWDNWGQVGLIAGVNILHDQVGKMGTTGLYGRLAGIIGDPRSGGLSLGISIGYVQYRLRSSETQPLQQGDPLLSADQTQWAPDVGFGLYYFQKFEHSKFFYVGASVPQSFQLDLTFRNMDNAFSLQRVRHYYGVIGFYHFPTNYTFIEPSIWIRYVEGVPFSADLNVRWQPEERFWVGGGVGTSKSVHFEFGLRLGVEKNYKIAYSADIGFNDYSPFFGSSHEIHLGYSLIP